MIGLKRVRAKITVDIRRLRMAPRNAPGTSRTMNFFFFSPLHTASFFVVSCFDNRAGDIGSQTNLWTRDNNRSGYC